MTVEFFVPGNASPGGSKKGFVNPKTGRVVIVDDAKNNKPWRDRVASFAREAMGNRQPFRGALSVRFYFFESRPKGHFGSGKNADRVRSSAPRHPAKKPDVLKLARAAEDALKGIIYVDDCQTIELRASKAYADSDRPGMHCVVKVLEAGEGEG